ncbi:hypothetical protein BH24ACT19_BH24ACT19_22320 [soil metagenome]|jgi:hypothetical protein
MTKEQAVKVREITEVHPNWIEQGRGDFGAFAFRLILDNGAEEYLLRPTVEDTKVLRKWIPRAKHLAFDTERKVLIVNDLPMGG